MSEALPGARKRVRVAHQGGGESRTKQSHARSVDVNTIVKNFRKTGQLPREQYRQAFYGDFGTSIDFHDALIRVQEARDQFMDLPADVRRAVNDDPVEFLDLVLNPARQDELLELNDQVDFHLVEDTEHLRKPAAEGPQRSEPPDPQPGQGAAPEEPSS